MEESTGRYSLLEDLDSRQNQVMAEIDALNDEILSVLKTWSVGDADEQPAADAA